MKPAAAAVLVSCVALVAPAVADEESTRVVKRAWKVELNEDSSVRYPVKPGATFRHCPGDDVTRIRFRGQMVHPSRKNVDYVARWFEDGEPGGEMYTWTAKGGWIRESYAAFHVPETGMRDGKWTVRIDLDYGDAIGRSSIRLKTVSGPAC